MSPIDRSASPAAKVAQLEALSRENEPVVAPFLKALDEEFGTKSKTSFKATENILEKSTRPSILERKPWFDVEHVRDAFRFKTVLDNIDQLPQVLERIKAQGWEIVKSDTPKVLEPGAWGWRIATFDLRMPNGQIVEHYMPIKEMEAAKKNGGHQIFEDWRNRDLGQLTTEEIRAYEAAKLRSNELYDAAWRRYLARTGQDESAVRASLSKADAVASGARENSSLVTSAENLIPGDHSPAASREAAQPLSSTSTRPSLATDTNIATSEQIVAQNEALRAAGARQASPDAHLTADPAAVAGAEERLAAAPKSEEAVAADQAATEAAAKLEATLESLKASGAADKTIARFRTAMEPFTVAVNEAESMGNALRAAALCGARQ